MGTSPKKYYRRVAYRHHSFPSSWESGCRGMGRARSAKTRPRHSLGHTPYRTTLCLFQWPTGLADGFGLKETALPATGRIHPGEWVPRSPAGDSAPEPLRYYVIATAGSAPSTPLWLCARRLVSPRRRANLLHLPLHMEAGLARGCGPCCEENFSLRPAALRMHQQRIS